MVGNFRGVLIFVTFVVDLAVMKITMIPNVRAQGQAVGVSDCMTGRAAEKDTTIVQYSECGSVVLNTDELMRIDENGTDVS